MVLVTGANGFVGRWVVRALLAAGHTVAGATGRDGTAQGAGLDAAERSHVQWMPLDLTDAASVRAIAGGTWDAVVHLAGVASGGDAMKDPGAAWNVNAAGTARLAGELGRRKAAGECDPLLIVASTAEVYGRAARPLVETDPLAPRSPYAASKRGAEMAADETAARTGLRVVLVRAFPHTGPGQDTRFVAPAFAERLRTAKRTGAHTVSVGNLDVTRDFLDVRDVARAYTLLLERGVPGEAYNVASGRATSLRDLFDMIGTIVGVHPAAECDPALMRAADIPYLVGDATKVQRAAGWVPAIPLETTLQDMVHAQAE